MIEAQTVQPSLTTPRVSKTYLTPQDAASYGGVATIDHETFTAMIPYLSFRDNVVVLTGQTMVVQSPVKTSDSGPGRGNGLYTQRNDSY